MLSKLSGREITVTSGGAEKFLNFIVSELIPFIESNYPVSKTDKILAGNLTEIRLHYMQCCNSKKICEYLNRLKGGVVILHQVKELL